MACLSSRIPHGEPVSEKKLGMIERAENVLRDLGFYDVRGRHHELPSANGSEPVRGSGRPVPGRASPPAGAPRPAAHHLARIKVGPDALAESLHTRAPHQ